MTTTDIEWTRGDDGAAGKSWNPVRGCSRVSPGCGGGTPGGGGGCYAERQAYRFAGPEQPYEGLVQLGKNGPRWTGVVRLVPEMLDAPLRWKKPTRVFVNSMSDLFHEALSNEDIAAVFGVMAAAPQHTFQVLTKRAERMRAWFEWIGRSGGAEAVSTCAIAMSGKLPLPFPMRWYDDAKRATWPLTNCWLGVSVEDQQRADERIPNLLATPAAIRFVSAEPLLGPVDLSRFMWPIHASWPSPFDSPEEAVRAGARVTYHRQALVTAASRFLDWVIVGGESGPGARPFAMPWARRIANDCRDAGVACFMKQLGARPFEDSGLSQEFSSFQQWVDKAQSWLRDGTWACFDARGRLCSTGADMAQARDEGAFPVRALPLLKLKDRKGGAIEEWPRGAAPWPREFPRSPL